MTALHANIVPSENWDDDFEFQQTGSSPTRSRNNKNPDFEPRMSIASSHFTEDWDHPNDTRQITTTTILEDKKNLYNPLADWAETAATTTPTKKRPPQSTENWDDDFEDKTDSPVRRAASRHLKKGTPKASSSRLARPPEPESWDDEFELGPPPTSSPSTSKRARDKYDSSSDDEPTAQLYPSDHDEDDDDDDAVELGFSEREEDRTVTARSRRAALSRLTSSNSSPPPPVPPLPFAQPRPFPRSPTSSVFSVPNTLGSGSNTGSSQYNHSTTHLRPTVSRTSAGTSGGFANLPPSPPIHKERERRRLRKKSRPQPQGVFELTSMPPRTTSRHSSDGDEDVLMRPRTPQTPIRTSPPLVLPPEQHTTSIASPSSSGKAALLSRIGSVKKWGVRKKRDSTAPSDILLQDRIDVDQDMSHDLTPRPPSSLISHPSSASKPPSNWFFRNSSTGSPHSSLGSSSDLHGRDRERERERERERGLMHTPTPDGASDSPSKLMKRKSLGFVQLRRGANMLVGNANASGEGEGDTGRRPVSMQAGQQMRHASYAGLGLGRVGKGRESADDLVEEREGDQKRSFSRSRSRDPKEREKDEKEKERDKDKEKEGYRGFMGSVRKISLVGRHKRTKSGVSLANVAEAINASLQSSSPEPRPPLPTANQERPRTGRSDVGDTQETSLVGRSVLLPPIELQPPSPPRIIKNSTSTPLHIHAGLDSLLSPSSSAPSVAHSPTYKTSPSSPTRSKTPASPHSTITGKAPSSPQAASLGRSAGAPSIVAGASIGNGGVVPRRNSLGDLKIPARISQAQVGLRRDLGMVREFAANVEQLKELQATYHALVSEVQGILDAHAHLHAQQQHSTRAVSPNFFRPISRHRSNTNPSTPPQLAYKQLASAFYTINSKYRISWECAELLIELGGGTTVTTPVPSSSVSAPAMQSGLSMSAIPDGKKGRERAITLAGDESKPPTPVSGSAGAAVATNFGPSPPLASPPTLAWRASTGRHDLSHRQLVLLKEMLSNPDSSFVVEDLNMSIPEESASLSVNRDWRWGDAMSSTVTLPSEDSGSAAGQGTRNNSPSKKRRSSRLGMSGLRDMLRSLKRSHSENTAPLPLPPPPPVPASSTSVSTESSLDSQNRHRYPHPHLPTQGRRRAKTSSGPESMRERDLRPTSPYSPASLSSKPSPRRPSLASIFRLGQKNKTTPPPTATTLSADSLGDHGNNVVMRRGSGQESSSTGEEEDWDRLDSASDLDAVAKALGVHDGMSTVRGTRGRSPYLQEAYRSSGHLSRPVTPKRSASGSQSSLWGESPSANNIAPPPRTTRLSNVEEHTDDSRGPRSSSKARHVKAGTSPSRLSYKASKATKNGSVRSMPPQPLGGSLPDPKLAMTPENIKPLLENTREVHARLTECIGEIRLLLSART